MKKLISFILACVLLAAAFCGCGKIEGGKKKYLSICAVPALKRSRGLPGKI